MEQPKIPTLKDTQSPQVKLRGLGAGLTLFDRLKQFKKKDLAFIMAGLGTLFMAPLAEHFMMSPESGDGTLSQGWSGRGGGGGSNIFGSGGSPYEPGTTGMAPGAAIGGGGDIITPLNVRDPSALVMGPGQTQQPPTNSVMPPTPPPTAPITRSDSDLKDALAASARGVGGAAKKAALPVPKVALTGSQLRGLGVAGGGSSAGANLGKIDASNVPNRGSTGGGLSRVTSAPGFKGVATRGPGTGGGGMDALKKAADNAGNVFNRGSAGSGLAEAAATQMSGGGNPFFGQGQGGAGPNDKGFGGNQDKNAKNLGESLAFLQKKERMQKDLELEYKKKEANDWGLQSALMRNEMLKTMSQGMAKALTEGLTGALKEATNFQRDSIAGFRCETISGNIPFRAGQFIPASAGYKLVPGGLLQDKNGGNVGSGCGNATQPGSNAGPQSNTPPSTTGDQPRPGGDQRTTTQGEQPRPDAVTPAPSADLGTICTSAAQLNRQAGTTGLQDWAGRLAKEADGINAGNVGLSGTTAGGCRGDNPAGTGNVQQLQRDAAAAIQAGLKSVKDAAAASEAPDLKLNEIEAKIKLAKDALDKVATHVGELPAATVPDPSAHGGTADLLRRHEEWTGKLAGIRGVLNRDLGTATSNHTALEKTFEQLRGMNGTIIPVTKENKKFESMKADAGAMQPPVAVGEPPRNDKTRSDEAKTSEALSTATKAIMAAYPGPKKIVNDKVPDAVKAVGAMRDNQAGWAVAQQEYLGKFPWFAPAAPAR